VSLTSHLRSPSSPVRRWMEARFPDLGEAIKALRVGMPLDLDAPPKRAFGTAAITSRSTALTTFESSPMEAFFKAVPGLAAALLGVVVAYLWFNFPGVPWAPVVVLGALVAVGYAVLAAGRRRIRRDPVGSLPFLEAWGLLILAGGALGAAILVILAVVLARLTPVGNAAEQKEGPRRGRIVD
jgi:hypothetical protein